MSDLLPCPFCGGEAKRDDTYAPNMFYGCPEAKCDVWVLSLDAWNRRAAVSGERATLDPELDEKNATLTMQLVAESGFESQSESRISARQWGEINAVIEGAAVSGERVREAQLVCIGELIEIDDGMQTKFVEWNDDRYKLEAGAKVYAALPLAAQPTGEKK